MVSLSNTGRLTWWSVVQTPSSGGESNDNNPTVSRNLGAAPWSKIELTKGTSFSIAKQLYSSLVLYKYFIKENSIHKFIYTTLINIMFHKLQYIMNVLMKKFIYMQLLNFL